MSKKISKMFSAGLLLGSVSLATLHCSSDDPVATPGGGGDDAGGGGGKGGKGGSGGKGSTAGSAGTGGTKVVLPSGGDGGLGGASGGDAGAAGAGGAGGASEVFNDLYIGCRDPLLGSIQHYRISTETGAVELQETALANAEVANTAWNADQTILYVAHADTGRISWFARDKATGKLTLTNFVVVPGLPLATDNPATQTLEVDKTGKFLLAANYTANTVQVFNIKADGGVGTIVQTVTDGLNAHQTVLNNTNKFVLVPYFGSNFIAVHGFDAATGMLSAHVPPTYAIPALDSGPRHLALHENAKWLYAITEKAGSIVFFDFDNTTGNLVHNETVSSLPATFVGAKRSGSEIEIHPNGKFLYVSNRLDEVANGILGAYSIAPATGKLTPIEFEDTKGKTPRLFSLSPGGELLVVGNQGSANMSVFMVNGTDGKLDLVKTTAVCDVPFFARMAVTGK